MVSTEYQRRSERQRYYKFVRSSGVLGDATENLDNRIHYISNWAKLSEMPDKQIQDSLKPVVDNAKYTLDQVKPFDDGASWNSYYRLMARIGLANELVLAPTIFASHDLDRRAELVDGVAGVTADIVAEALDNFHDERADKTDKDSLRGVINEYTSITLANYNEDGKKILLPSSLFLDVIYKIDSLYYATDSNGDNFYSNIQVKSSRRPRQVNGSVNRRPSAPDGEHLIHLFSNDFGNGTYSDSGFKMSKIIVNELHNNTRDTMTSNKRKNKILDAIGCLERYIEHQKSILNTTYTD
jgi:hypothetical protein